MSVLLKDAIVFARTMHQGQIRKTGERYVDHCFRVANTIAKHTNNEEILIAAILHDIFEDTEMSIPTLANTFTPKISFIVNSLSKNNKYKNHDADYRVRTYLIRFKKGCIAEPWIMFIKMADQIDNASSFEIFRPEKRERKIKEIEELFMPIYEKIFPNLSIPQQKIYNSLLTELCAIVSEKKAL